MGDPCPLPGVGVPRSKPEQPLPHLPERGGGGDTEPASHEMGPVLGVCFGSGDLAK